MKKISIIDSHTGGEPTRLIVAGGPDLGTGTLAERVTRFKTEFDHYRTATTCEPRGSDVMVGALACVPDNPECTAGVIFFNNVGYLGMCGHGMIGFVASLAYQGKISVGQHQIDTPVGVVQVELHADDSVTVHNVTAWRYRKEVIIEVAGHGLVRGDVAWGGNWFFLIADHGQELQAKNIDALTDFCWRVRQALEANEITGEHGALIDHIELFGTPDSANNHSKNFVLCPGKAYDRSPCGTGTSAKLACLAADGKLTAGEIWWQESIIGSVFEASYQTFKAGQNIAEAETDAGEKAESNNIEKILPSIRGKAFVNAEATLLLDERDPFVWGMR